ncbi:MAG: PSD1 domain-containing protein [Planctomycetaceae bacterium]|nr:PSD1 domain-containing protein [Planctomycetales bacterium]MCB9922772.1 PSD1 domain-containing protein [Planctomycetaceae bacterium]
MKILKVVVLGTALAATVARAEELGTVNEAEKLFALRVKPLLAEKCLACHGENPDEIEGGLDLRSRDSAFVGGESFKSDVVIVGDGDHSMLYVTTTRREEGYEMPPKEADRLSQEQQWWIRDWINAGAPWPSDERVGQIQQRHSAGEQVLVSRALSDQWQNRRYEPEKLWAYRPIQRADVPQGQHPVDWFINRKLVDANLTPAPPADAITLVRRMSYGLKGLPPSPLEVEEFQAEYEANPDRAINSFANRLMASPHYGEHFGWHWLDIVRYADTAGFANDYSRPNAWRYRDFVVRSFNGDKPYDQFVRQQIAGDEIDESHVENLIATGFLRMGPWEQTSMSVFKETRGQWLDDVTDTVGQAFLAHSMLCCKCHDHKFDPVPTRDYYRMMAVFSTTQFAERDAPFMAEENLNGFGESDEWVEAKIAAYEKQQKQLEAKIAEHRTKETGSAKVGDNGLDPGDEASSARIAKNIARHQIERDRTKAVALTVYTGATLHRKNVSGRISLPKDRWSQGEIERDAIHLGGNVYSLADPVVPGALSAAESLGHMQSSDFPGDKGQRRLALANWIVDPSNPLTARVIVNRIWSWHFGKGIASNPNNFGGTGGLPTHPELLDYLASWFIENGWSIKKLNYLIVTSNAYRRDSRHPEAKIVAERDPLGNLYATFSPRRLTAEELRDAMLAVSGELNATVGGIPCRPDINREVAFQPRQIMGGTASVYEPDPLPAQRNRRTLYTERIRGLRDPFLETFNQPGPDKSCELRETSTVAPQALTLMNSEEVFDRSIAFANRLICEELPDDEATLCRAFQLAFGRQPNGQELRICLKHWREAAEEEATKKYERTEFPERLTRTVMAEKTGQPYSFVEIMPAYVNYQPDLQPADVDARTRGLANVCRVLLNSSEFSYLD